MVVLHRLDTLLEPNKEAVSEEVKFQQEDMQSTELDDAPLIDASGYIFYNAYWERVDIRFSELVRWKRKKSALKNH